MSTLIWGGVLDDRYDVKVVMNEDGEYRLQIVDGRADNAVLIYDQVTEVFYTPTFGPDIDDVMRWEEEAIAFIDSRGQA